MNRRTFLQAVGAAPALGLVTPFEAGEEWGLKWGLQPAGWFVDPLVMIDTGDSH
jgi:hypothetical protein